MSPNPQCQAHPIPLYESNNYIYYVVGLQSLQWLLLCPWTSPHLIHCWNQMCNWPHNGLWPNISRYFRFVNWDHNVALNYVMKFSWWFLKFFKQCFARSSTNTIRWFLQLVSAQKLRLSWKSAEVTYHQIVSIDASAKLCFANEYTLTHNTYMRNPDMVYVLKMEYMSIINIFGIKMMVKSGLEKIFLKFLHAQGLFQTSWFTS